MRYHIWTEGCQMNEADSEKLAAGLAKLGWEEAAKANEADLAVVNTCVVRQKAEDRAAGYLGLLRKLKESRGGGLQIAVMGCMVGPRTDDLRSRFPYVNVWARPQSFEVVLRHVMPDSELGGAKGVREVTLLGQTVEAYGKDLPAGESGAKPDLASLFEAIHDTPRLQRIRFLTSYPRDMTERIVRSVAHLPKVCEHFNIPLQAGDNDVLARMRRGYTIEEYVEWVLRIREVVPDATLSTDVIVGFCGETEAQFKRTLGVLEQLRFDKVHVAAFSPRPGTIAWRHMEDTVPQDEKMRRLHAVEALQERVGIEINARLVGTVQEVLMEGEKDGVLTGRNRGNKLVHFREQGTRNKEHAGPIPGYLVNVTITRATAWSLQGEIAATVAA